MKNPSTPTSAPQPDEDELLEDARHESQVRAAELHIEEGTVKSEEAQNSPHPDDHD